MTGAPMPAGADAVVMVEETDRVGDERVLVKAAVAPGQAVRAAGDDVQPGDLLFTPGTVVRPAVLGVLASVNAREVSVHPRARVAVLSTGDELIEDGGPLRPGQIRESNRRMLAGLLRETGCEVVDFGTVRDDEAALEVVLREAAGECDAIVTSGGVSMGDYDVVKAVLGRIADMRWMQIAIKPAKPFAFGTIGGTPIFGLPGNPVSSLVSFEMLARPALRRMMGHRAWPGRATWRSPTTAWRGAPTARCTWCVPSPRSRTTAAATSAPTAPRAATSSRRRRWPTRSRWSPTARASRPVVRSPSSCS